MQQFVKVISWVMLIVAVLAFIGLVSNPDTTNNGPGIIVAIGIFAQSLCTLIMLEEQNGRN